MVKFMRMRARTPLFVLAAIEAVLLLVTFYIGLNYSWVEFSGVISNPAEFAPKAVIYIAVMLAMVFAVGLYNLRYLTAYSDTVVRLAVAMFLGTIVLTALFYVFPDLVIWRSVMLPALAAAFVLMGLTRFIATRVLGLDMLQRRIAVVGVGERAARIEALEREGHAFGLVCVGYFDATKEAISVPRSRIIPRDLRLEDVVRERRVDEVVIASDNDRHHLPTSSLVECRLNGVAITPYNAFYERETGAVDLDTLDPAWLLFSEGLRGGMMHEQAKRIFDVTVSLLFLMLFLPLLVGTAIAIRLESKGPVILRQTRVGFRGREFTVYKFRSMRTDSEKDGVPQWAAANDPRITRVGTFIRKFRVDEIPQLINVMQGHMSFVGPRPERPFFVEQLGDEIPHYDERHLVKPGITGWAQLNYQYGASVEDARRKLQYDLYYLHYQNVLLDLAIILQTVRVVLWPQGVR